MAYCKKNRLRWDGLWQDLAVKARRCDPEMDIVIYQEEDEISYAGCGLPYYISGVIKNRDELVSRTPEKFALDGIRLMRHHQVEAIDLKNHMVSGRNLEKNQVFSNAFDRLPKARRKFAISTPTKTKGPLS